MMGCKPNKTLIELSNKEKMFEGDSIDKESYQRFVGKLIYHLHTRSNIAFALSLVNQYMHAPCQGHLDVVYRILRYLKQAPKKDCPLQKLMIEKLKYLLMHIGQVPSMSESQHLVT